MKKNKELIRNTIILTFGRITTQFVSFLLLPIITYFLNTEEYGHFDLITTYVLLFTPIISLDLEMAAFRFLIDSRGNEKKKKEVITNSIFTVFGLTIFISIIFSIIGNILNIKHMFLIILMLFATISSNLLLQISRGLGDNITYSLSGIIAAIINIVITIILLMLGFGIKGVLIANSVANLIVTVFISLKKKIYNYYDNKTLNKSIQKRLLKYSLPLVPNGLLWWIINSSDRFIISTIIDVSANGIYSISNKFSNIINSVYSIFNMSWTESVSLYIDDKDNFLENTFNQIFDFICCFCLLLINSMFIIFPILINNNYIESYKYIPILIISSVFNMLSSNLSAIYIAKKETREIAKSTVLAGIINIVINIIFIKYIGLYAASISTLIAFMLLFIVRYIKVQKYVTLKLKINKIIIYIFAFSISYYIYFISNMILDIILLIITIIFIMIFNKKIVPKILNMLNKKGDKYE